MNFCADAKTSDTELAMTRRSGQSFGEANSEQQILGTIRKSTGSNFIKILES